MAMDRRYIRSIVWWVIWVMLTADLLLLPLLLGVPLAQPATPGPVAIWGCLIPIGAATLLRWTSLPKTEAPNVEFMLFVAGLALAELGGLMAVFLRPLHAPLLYALSLAGMLQFLPSWVLRGEKNATSA